MQDPIPGNNEKYKPFIDANHDAVTAELTALIDGDKTLTSCMDSLIMAQVIANKELFEKLTQIGYYFIPVTDEGKLTDDTRLRDVHSIATTCALTCLDLLCNELDIDKIQFRNIWLKSGLLTIVDIHHEYLAGKSLRDKHDSVVQGVIELGHRALAELPNDYSSAAEQLSDDPLVLENANLFKGVFGHVLDGGYKILSKLNDINMAQRIDFDAEILRFINQPTPYEAVNTADIDHALIADRLDTELFYGEDDDGFEANIGMFTEKLFDLDSDVTEVGTILAWAVYSNHYQHGALDSRGESFFSGMVLALKAIDMTSPVTGVELVETLRYWKRQYAHKKLLRSRWADEDMQLFAAGQVSEQLKHTDVTGQYMALLDKICTNHSFEGEEIDAFTAGFGYMMNTGMNALGQRDKNFQNQFVKLHIENMDHELEMLLKQGLE